MLILRFLAACAAVVAATSASAQTTNPSSAPQVTVPSGQNSGAGIPGKPDTESGPAPKSLGTGSTATNQTVREQDAAKVPGLPGSKSGPAVHPPSGSTSAQNTGSGLQSIQQQLRQNLQRAGFTDVQVMPSSFLVRAKDPGGNPVMMVINPDSVTAVTESDVGTPAIPNQDGNPGSTMGGAAPNSSSSPAGR